MSGTRPPHPPHPSAQQPVSVPPNTPPRLEPPSPPPPYPHPNNTGGFPAVPHPSAPSLPAHQTGPFPAQVATPPNGTPLTRTLPLEHQNAVRPVSGAMPAFPAQHVHAQPAAAPQARLTVKYPQVGTVLRSKRGEYLVLRVIGTGEFGAVYECNGPFDQLYAVKVIRPANRPFHEVQAEWARETGRLFSLRHPNIVYLYDAFEQDLLFYQALERCDHPLSDMLKTPMQEGLVIELARQLLAAVQFLHDQDILHDDLHPGNVLVSHTDRPVLKISDFGISAELRGAPAIRPNVVHHKIMPPEILTSGMTTKQSDIYQVGLLLYWMVCAEPAIPPNLPYQELMRFVSEGEPRKRAEAIGTPLAMLIAKMLRRRETFRYTSAREVWAELRLLPAWQNRQLFPVK